MMSKKSIISISCLVALLVVCLCSSATEARPKRSIVLASPVVAAAPVVASVPVVRTAAVVHSNPTTVVKTEQVHAGDRSSYSYSTEVQSHPVVTHHAVAAAAPAAVVSPIHHTVPTYAYGYYPSAYSYYSPYQYVIGK